jgi:hypothetical protein
VISDETLEVHRFDIQGYVCMFLQYLPKPEAPELGSTEVVRLFDVRGTLHVVWSKLPKLKAAECQSNETSKRQPRNSEVQSSGEIRCKGIRTSEAQNSEAPEPESSEEVPSGCSPVRRWEKVKCDAMKTSKSQSSKASKTRSSEQPCVAKRLVITHGHMRLGTEEKGLVPEN